MVCNIVREALIYNNGDMKPIYLVNYVEDANPNNVLIIPKINSLIFGARNHYMYKGLNTSSKFTNN